MSTEIDRLVVVFDANFQALNDKLDKAIARNKQAAKDVESAWAGKGLFGAAEKGLDSFVEHVGEAARSIPVFGASLGALGPIGAAAAVGVGAFGIAMEQTNKAIEDAAGIGKLATTVGVSTDFIQKFNFAAKETEVDVGAADNALKALNASVGAVQGNLPRAKQLAVVFADALKITPDQLRSYHDLEDLFPLIADRIKNAGSAAEQAAIAKKLGIEELLPLLKLGADGFNELAGEADRAGVVIKASTIEAAQKAQEKLKALDAVMQAQKTSTFVQYADTLIAIKTAFNDVTAAFLHFMAVITNTEAPGIKINKLTEQIAQVKQNYGWERSPVDLAIIQRAQAEIDKLGNEIGDANARESNRRAADAAAAKAQVIVPPTVPKTKRGPQDETNALTKSALDAYQSSLKGLADAQASLTDSLTERNRLEKAAVDAELTKQKGDIDAQINKVKEAQKKGLDKQADAQLKELAAAKVNDEIIANDKKILLDKQLLTQILDANVAREQTIADMQANALNADAEHLTALADLTTTAKDRATYERLALQEQQLADRTLADAKLKEAQDRLDFANQMGASADAIDPLQQAVDRAQQARDLLGQKQSDQTTALNKSLETPLQKYVDGIKSVDDAMQEWAVGGLNDLASGFAKAVVEGGKLTDVAKSIFQKIAEDMIQSFVEQTITKPAASFLSSLITGHAAGDLTGAAGGLALVGEAGPELVSLPGGSRVFSNSQLRQVGLSGGGAGQPTIVFDNRGAVIWEQAARTMMAYADQTAARAGLTAVSTSRTGVPMELARQNGRSLGR
jgi:hypothetical protein